MKALRSILNLACFAAGLALVWVAFALSGPPFELGSVLKQKLEVLKANRDRYDTLYVGSSRTFRHLDPTVIDAVAAEHGLQIRSFNFAIDGMFAPEDSYALEMALKAKPQGLRWVLLEVSTFLPLVNDVPNPPQRVIFWHDWPRTLACFHAAWRAPKIEGKMRWKKKRERYWEAITESWPKVQLHLRSYTLRTTRAGLGAAALDRALSWSRITPPRLPLEERHGFIAITDPATPAEIAQFQNAMAERRASPAEYRPLPASGQRNLERMLAAIRAAGAKPILMHAPVPAATIHMPEASGVPVLNYSIPEKYPELFELEVRKEHAHLNARGAEIFSRILGKDWAAAAR